MSSILCVAGARPNFMKIAPVINALKTAGLAAPLVHTGQHYDEAMSAGFFNDLGIPEPEVNLEVGSGTHAKQTAEIMIRFEPVLENIKPKAILVVGDVNSTIACALVAAKLGVGVFHVEAGLRSFDRRMPEEVNRVLTDQISDLLFVTERSGLDNLAREGIAPEKCHFVGNVMIDSLFANRQRAIPAAATLAKAGAGFSAERYAVLTLHRPSNVDDPKVLGPLLAAIREIAEEMPVIFPIHPRTRNNIKQAGLSGLIETPNIALIPPVGYLEMLGLTAEAKLVLTDSGGLQEESTALGVPCFTLRENTERPITIDEGTNSLIGPDPKRLKEAFADLVTTGGKAGRVPELWDGQAASRIAQNVKAWGA
jgi:UDP-N-acetylglucosamine 2-epimerase (non-hydrolysing)